MGALEGEIVAKRTMDDRRRRIERRAHIRDRLKLFILDCDVLSGILGHGTARRHDGRDRFALPADTVGCDGILGRRF